VSSLILHKLCFLARDEVSPSNLRDFVFSSCFRSEIVDEVSPSNLRDFVFSSCFRSEIGVSKLQSMLC
jgi:hypothetical protein